tara:strand:- start:57 stop:671 length:615 start_codon:yes stop_codon:yes gene_type:complete
MTKWLSPEFPYLIGYYGYLTMPAFVGISIISKYYFSKQGLLLTLSFSVFTLLNQMFNGALKRIVMQARPTNQINIVPHDANTHPRMGMPSGHAQSVAFSLMFLFRSVESTFLRVIGAIMTFLTLLQRITYRKHTKLQVLVGFTLGSLMGYVGYESHKWLKATFESLKIDLTDAKINMGFIGAFSLIGLCLLIDKLHLVEKLRKL